MTKFYLFEKKKWICKKQIEQTISLAFIDKFIFSGNNVTRIETAEYDVDKDILQVYLR